MKNKLVVLLISLTLVMSLVIVGCPAPAPPEVAELEKEVAAERAKVAAEKARVAELEEEIAGMVPAPEVYKWRQQRYYGPAYDHLYEWFKDDIETLSDGRLQIEIFRGAEIVPNDMLLEAVSDGTLEVGVGFGAYWPGLVDVGIIESGLATTWGSLGEALWFWYEKGFIDLVQEAYAEHNVLYICPEFGSDYELLTKVPVHSLDDMKGLKIRATAAVAAILEKFDIPTVYLPPEELYLALATGTIDGLIYGGAFDYKQLKLHEVATYYTKVLLLKPGYVDNHLVNMDAWNTLPEDLQRILEMGCFEVAREFHVFAETGNYEVVGEELFTITSLPPEDGARLVAAAQEVWDEEAAKSPRCAKAIEMLREMAKSLGRL